MELNDEDLMSLIGRLGHRKKLSNFIKKNQYKDAVNFAQENDAPLSNEVTLNVEDLLTEDLLTEDPLTEDPLNVDVTAENNDAKENRGCSIQLVVDNIDISNSDMSTSDPVENTFIKSIFGENVSFFSTWLATNILYN